MKLENSFFKFLKEHFSERAPMLLGLSGGPDSLALFHLLLENDYPFEVAHIDHGWRKESSEEAAYLTNMCLDHGIPFHLKRLTPPKAEKNLEEEGRKERLAFFKALLERQMLKGVFLGHHADDQAETVLKRLFEGASLPKLRGLLPKIDMEGILIYRPFLKVQKRFIINWLKEKEVRYFTDPTNQNPRFLRSRLREEIIPNLSANFGKEISSNLCRLGEAAAELGDFLDDLIAPYKEKIVNRRGEISIDFNTIKPASSFLWKCLIQDFCAHLQLSLTHSVLEVILFHLQKGSCHKSLFVGRQKVIVHQKKLIIPTLIDIG